MNQRAAVKGEKARHQQAANNALGNEGKTAQDPMGGYNAKQRFFLSFAQVWCQNQGARGARRSAAADPQSPGHWRVNGTIQNFDEFGKAFGCTRGAPHVPGKLVQDLVA